MRDDAILFPPAHMRIYPLGLGWHLGFGWPTVLGLVGAAVLAFRMTGPARWAAIVVLLFLTIWAMHGFHWWNGTVWRRLHFRGARIYVTFAARESLASQAEARPFNTAYAVRDFAMFVCRGDATLADRLLAGIAEDPGGYLLNLVVAHKAILFPNAQPGALGDVAAIFAPAKKIKLHPAVFLCRLVEDRHGSDEAARYAYAIIMGKAS